MKSPLLLLSVLFLIASSSVHAQIVPPPSSSFCDPGPQKAHVTFEFANASANVSFSFVELSCTPEAFETGAGILRLQSGMSRYVNGNAIVISIIPLKS